MNIQRNQQRRLAGVKSSDSLTKSEREYMDAWENGITGGKAFIVIFEEPGYSPYDETYKVRGCYASEVKAVRAARRIAKAEGCQFIPKGCEDERDIEECFPFCDRVRVIETKGGVDRSKHQSKFPK